MAMNSQSTTHETTSAQHQHGSGWHMWLMLACCVAPIAAIVAVTVFGVPFNSLITLAVLLVCPLMMVLMMRGDHR